MDKCPITNLIQYMKDDVSNVRTPASTARNSGDDDSIILQMKSVYEIYFTKEEEANFLKQFDDT